ncbi:unnamed protein product [Mytilus coruscus]|uniref:Uncharacterized protein n=1 Tax=Mytilus coruscus TaxID=42192 RepID=A0A6J8C7Z0_MYTCO|nr:unnamed protein product [Mytilus coruscus]
MRSRTACSMHDQLVKDNTVVPINDVTGMLSTSSIQPENSSTTDSQGPMLAVFQPPISSDPNINTPSDERSDMKIFGIIVLVALLMVASVTMPVAASRRYSKGYKGSHSSGGHSGHGGKYHGYHSFTFKLDSAVEQCFDMAPTCFLTTGNNPGYTIGIKKIDEHYYDMDSHNRDDKGLSLPLGKAVVLQFNPFEQLVKYIKDICHSLSNTDMQYELTPIVIRKASVLAPLTIPQPTDDTNEINQNNPSPQCFEPADIEHVADDNPLPDSDISVDGGRTDSNVQQNFDAIVVGNSDPLLLTDDQKHMLICNRMPEPTFKFP